MSIKHNPPLERPSWIVKCERLDLELGRWLNFCSVWPLVCQPFRLISRLGDGLIWYTVFLLLPLMFGWAGLMLTLQLAVSGLFCTWIYLLLKRSTSRLRPCDASDAIQARMPPLDKYSFPSGHTLHAVAFSTLLIAALPSLAPWLLGFTLLIALSRLVLGLHYPSDVLVGALLGWLLARLSLAIHLPLPL
ncbi:undecaprenyl-diphosphatase [Marinospirillum celere]|uniref:undecaprenyl-diphosphate phosphatase n=1 Tax=Marinospirillum celere TaxID=1122252 RepID=A0A1I1DTG1_9GAMM|nr:phosphatase PAP2 family protein [Marinospirillum celere]SFB78144.1 undecaprenyl-diphosphatase [Marinospirillum celere]